ncbi:MAG: hypothetical protein B7Y11_01745 [Sphingobacteriia bacterium 24-36-13]|jgi:hypothetical protein|uniref:hypothetical protein n=1 Tax=Sediminibacterium sp. TaxID=1917865 RepID=UPI000BDC60AD|nr:hypothetical protein [Sediminibacterium sp.]OYZ55367.1 MAG: hypothetical protein B7Y11_01745 [Sphingobacteriia bacterium 24-36-13]OZA66327.1 MAG: hypothetical protein B7X68_01230 [Sphingobacteriia bacterium 39-36-14]HQS22910.1 hypothetical protein [Sediminibacterium sp.]HQS33914.1 hypothetical protein [Sediminibacterium sp.]
MNDATQYYIRDYPQTATAKTTGTAPTVGRVCQLDAKTQRGKRNPKGQTEVRTPFDVANNFLKSTFLPKLKTAHSAQACTENEKTERDFYHSLSLLAEDYGFKPMQTKSYGYPYNISLALWDTQEKLKQIVYNWNSLQFVQDRKKAFFISEERYSAGATLYYIPVIPLFEMLNDPMRKKTAQLLVSVCSYLYHIVSIPYYRQENSYLYWMYEMLTDWVEQDEETSETELYKNELRQAEWVGERVEQKLFNRTNLSFFEQRVKIFKPTDEFDKECLQLACDALALYVEYPHTNIFRNAPKTDEGPDDECEDYDRETIGMEKYISFMANGKGWLYESLSDSINNEFNEYGNLEEPTIRKCFDGNPITRNNLDFEARLFTLLEDICYLLNNYKATRR